MSRDPKIAIGALVVLLAAAPFVPRGDDEDGAVAPIGEAEYAAPRWRPPAGRVDPGDARARSTGSSTPAGPSAESPPRSTPAHARRRPGPVRGLRGPALLPAHRLDQPAPSTRSRPGSAAAAARDRPHGRRRPPSAPATSTRLATLDRTASLDARRRALRPSGAELDRGRPLGREGLAAAPRDPGRRPPRTASSTTTPRRGAARRPRRPTPATKGHADYPEHGPGPHRDAGRRAEPHLLVRPHDDADDRLGLAARDSAASSSGPAGWAPPPTGTAHHRDGAGGQQATPAATARTAPAPTSSSTSPTGPSASGCCCRSGTSSTTARRWCCTRFC